MAWNRPLAWLQLRRDVPLLRLELHPQDGDHAAVARCWQRVLAAALGERRPLRLGEAAALAHRQGSPAAATAP